MTWGLIFFSFPGNLPLHFNHGSESQSRSYSYPWLRTVVHGSALKQANEETRHTRWWWWWWWWIDELMMTCKSHSKQKQWLWKTAYPRIHKRRSSVNLGGKTFLPENYMHEKLTKCPNFTWYLSEKLTKFPNFTWYMPEFYVIFAQKYFSRILGDKCPLPPVSYAYARISESPHCLRP